jgi:hypothetical protein
MADSLAQPANQAMNMPPARKIDSAPTRLPGFMAGLLDDAN